MFGLLRVPKGLLTEEERRIYNAYYCGVCRALGRQGSSFFKLALSYDAVALAMFIASFDSEEQQVDDYRCWVNPLKVKSIVNSGQRCFDQTAQYYLLLGWLKLQDDLNEYKLFPPGSVRIKERICRQTAGYLFKYVNSYQHYSRFIGRQLEAEQSDNSDLDDLAEVTCGILQNIAADSLDLFPELPDLAEQKIMAGKIGYNLGKWIYIWDALTDYEKDNKSGKFNAINKAFSLNGQCPSCWPQRVLEEVDYILRRSLQELINNLEVIAVKRNRQLLLKIFHGAFAVQRNMFVKKYFEEDDYDKLPAGWGRIRN